MMFRKLTSPCLLILTCAVALAATPSESAAQNVRGFVFGEESGAPMEGVLVRLMSRTLDPIDTTRTDLLGRFSFQASGPQRYVVVAEKDGYAAAPQIIEVSAIALATVGVTISLAPMGATTEDEDALGDERIAHIRGRVVVAGSNDGIENAEVTDVVTGRSVLTRYDGRFVLGDVRPGPVRMRIDHLAYTAREWAVDTEPGTAYDALIPLEVQAIPLEGIEVTVRSRAVARKLEPVFERMARNLGGMYLSATDFKKRGYGPVANMIQGLPSVTVRGTGYRWQLNFRRGGTQFQPGCAPEIWLDGVRVVRSGGDVSEFMSMNTIEVEVIELFPSASSIPAEYSTSALCAVGIWTKRGG